MGREDLKFLTRVVTMNLEFVSIWKSMDEFSGSWKGGAALPGHGLNHARLSRAHCLGAGGLRML